MLNVSNWSAPVGSTFDSAINVHGFESVEIEFQSYITQENKIFKGRGEELKIKRNVSINNFQVGTSGRSVGVISFRKCNCSTDTCVIDFRVSFNPYHSGRDGGFCCDKCINVINLGLTKRFVSGNLQEGHPDSSTFYRSIVNLVLIPHLL